MRCNWWCTYEQIPWGDPLLSSACLQLPWNVNSCPCLPTLWNTCITHRDLVQSIQLNDYAVFLFELPAYFSAESKYRRQPDPQMVQLAVQAPRQITYQCGSNECRDRQNKYGVSVICLQLLTLVYWGFTLLFGQNSWAWEELQQQSQGYSPPTPALMP